MIRREFLTAEEAARMIGTSEAVIRKLARDGQIPGYKIGKRWRFDPAELRAACSNSRVTA